MNQGTGSGVYDANEVYSGPYVEEAPDLIVGFQPGHRAGWLSVTGGVSEEEREKAIPSVKRTGPRSTV